MIENGGIFMKKKLKIVLVIILFIPVAIILLIRPTKTLNLQYTSLDLNKKIIKELLIFNDNITFTNDELTNILKETLVQSEDEALDYVTGINLDIDDGEANLYVNLKYGILKVGFRGIASLTLEEDDLLVTPKKLYLGRLPISQKKAFALLDKLTMETSYMVHDNGQFVVSLSEITNKNISKFVSINNISLEDDSLKIYFDTPIDLISTALSKYIDTSLDNSIIGKIAKKEISNIIKKYSKNNISNKIIEEILETINTMTDEEKKLLLKKFFNYIKSY